MKNQLLNDYSQWVAHLKYEDIPSAVVEEAKNQIISTVAAIFYGYQSELGRKIGAANGVQVENENVWKVGISNDLLKTAYTLACWSMIHDFDDVMLGGHTGHSSVIVPLALGLYHKGSGKDVIVAQVAANEIAARLNIACALGQTRGQMASHLHLIAASVARAKYEEVSCNMIASTLAFALSSPGTLSLPAFLGSDAKVYAAAWPVRMGWEALDCVRAGLSANHDVVDGPFGFLQSHGSNANQDLLRGLGKEWFTLTNSYKLHPACGYISSAIECAIELANDKNYDINDVRKVRVEANIFTYGVAQYSDKYLNGAKSSTSTLSFSPRFVIASGLFYKKFTPENYQTNHLNNQQVWELVDKIEVAHSFSQTRKSLFKGIPVGIVLSNARMGVAWSFMEKLVRTVFFNRGRLKKKIIQTVLFFHWMTSKAEPLEDLSASTKPLGTTIKVFFKGKGCRKARKQIPDGFLGGKHRESVRLQLKDKYMASAIPLVGDTTAADTLKWIESLESIEDINIISLIEGFSSNTVGKVRLC